jgi:peptidoglycan/LPS O-acetylase OafA/YrhL
MRHRASSQWELLALARFMLAMVVLLGHLNERPGWHAWWTAIGLWFNQGSAVYGFLLISGYSIAASLDRSAEGFVWRRVQRIYPTYLASLGLAALSVVAGASPPMQAPVWQFAAMALMLQTFAYPTIVSDGQLWTLAVEWWNYILAPLYRRLQDVGVGLLAALSFALFLMVKVPLIVAYSTGGLMFATMSWLWMFGFLYHRRRRTFGGYSLLLLPAIVAPVFGGHGPAVCIGAMALALCEEFDVPERLGKAFRWLGDLSYPVYAVHVPVFAFCTYCGVRSPAVVAFWSIATSVLILHAVDLPMRGLKFRSLMPAPAG